MAAPTSILVQLCPSLDASIKPCKVRCVVLGTWWTWPPPIPMCRRVSGRWLFPPSPLFPYIARRISSKALKPPSCTRKLPPSSRGTCSGHHRASEQIPHVFAFFWFLRCISCCIAPASHERADPASDTVIHGRLNW
ncbi:hypothetical protein CSHISOI_04862 [Colletotrichum shisoi]|uniref:Uncharacterized protein n=1 Tax=Colletotrichum shisoi TaxID=2078593 RepID=A0A5Q4BWA1_9PEZI|nr:hypothetical protein CSHISOI_04862 [Colletotrichum shisoi]